MLPSQADEGLDHKYNRMHLFGWRIRLHTSAHLVEWSRLQISFGFSKEKESASGPSIRVWLSRMYVMPCLELENRCYTMMIVQVLLSCVTFLLLFCVFDCISLCSCFCFVPVIVFCAFVFMAVVLYFFRGFHHRKMGVFERRMDGISTHDLCKDTNRRLDTYHPVDLYKELTIDPWQPYP